MMGELLPFRKATDIWVDSKGRIRKTIVSYYPKTITFECENTSKVKKEGKE